jgi:hypothetical protein
VLIFHIKEFFLCRDYKSPEFWRNGKIITSAGFPLNPSLSILGEAMRLIIRELYEDAQFIESSYER